MSFSTAGRWAAAFAAAWVGLWGLAGPAGAEGFRGAGRYIVYPDGRVFTPRGFNVITTQPPLYPAFFGDDDARLLAELGFTAIRIGFEPEALEPKIGRFDMDYLKRFSDLDRLAQSYGIGTFMVLNQDNYTRRCPLFGPLVGDGFPDWMIKPQLKDKLSADECKAAWEAFQNNVPAEDGVGLRDHFVRWWEVAAEAFKGSRNIIGHNLINEPHGMSAERVEALYRPALAAIRAIDPDRILFVEDEPVTQYEAHPRWIRRARLGQVGYSDHNYCLETLFPALVDKPVGAETVDRCIGLNQRQLEQTVDYVTAEGFPYYLGEFGAVEETREQSALVDAADSAFVPWTVYAYNAQLDGSGPAQQRFLVDEARPASLENAVPAKVEALVTPYPMAIAGTPKSWRFDRASRIATLVYSTAPVAGAKLTGAPPTVIFVPKAKYPTGYGVAVRGGRATSSAGAPWLLVVADPGAPEVSVTLAPRTDGVTRTPLEVDQCGYDLAPCGRAR